jgi:hypothetical protein
MTNAITERPQSKIYFDELLTGREYGIKRFQAGVVTHNVKGVGGGGFLRGEN